jgi:hypothetical protein
MGKSVVVFAMFFAACLSSARAETQKSVDELSGCAERAVVEQYISQHNYAELLRGESAGGKTQGVWTNGTQLLVLTYVRPADGKMDELKTICVSNAIAKVKFNFNVIESLVKSAADSLKPK